MARLVLIIDNDPEARTYLSNILLRGGFEVATAADGRDGWRQINEKKPDLILLDMLLPKRSGRRVLSQFKSDPELNRIPIIVVSGLGRLLGVDVRKYAGGRDDDGFQPHDFLDKPVGPDRLLQAVNAALGG